MGSFIVTGKVADSGSARDNRKVRINYSETTDILTNTSVITITSIELSWDFGALYWLDGYVRINGSVAATVEGYNTPVSSATVKSDKSWVTVSNVAVNPITVSHNDDGSGSCVFSFIEKHGFYVYPPANKGLFAYQQGGSNHTVFTNPNLTVTLTTIPRASSISCPNTTLGNSAAASITKQASSFTSTVYVKVGNTTVETLATKTASTSVAWTPSLVNYASRFAGNSKTLTATMVIDTYNGNTFVGSKSISVVLTMPNNSTTKPSASFTHQDSITNSGVYAQSHSKLRIQTTASGKYNATISSIVVTISGRSYSGSDITTSEITSSGSVPIVIVVTDSRGYSTTINSTVTVYAWNAPSVSGFSIIRCDSGGEQIDSGTYIRVRATVSVSSLNNTNAKSWKIQSRLVSASSWSDVASGTLSAYNTTIDNIYSGYSVNNTYDVRLIITDFYLSSESYGGIQSEFCLINYHSSGTSIAFGKVAERANIFECALPVCGNVASLFGNDAEISSGADLNNYKECGTWSITSNTIAASLVNCPSTFGGSLIVRDGNARGYSTSQTYCYRQQIYIPYAIASEGFYIRAIHSHGTSGAWTYDAWSFFSAVDGIKSEGIRGDWFYRIWSSGKKELWYKKTVSITTPTQRGQLWISDENTVSYPSGFTFDNSVFCVPNADAYGSATHPPHMFNVHASSNSIKYRVDCTASTTISLTVTFYIIGW